MNISTHESHAAWNRGKLIGQKAPLQPKDVWSIRIRLQIAHRVRKLALFNLGFDSKLRGCDLVALRAQDVCHGDKVASRVMVMQRKTRRPVQFEITQPTREAVEEWIRSNRLKGSDYLFPSRIHDSPHIGTRQYARILHGWVQEIGLDPTAYGTHSMRRSKASMIYKKLRTCAQFRSF
jgi:integrase